MTQNKAEILKFITDVLDVHGDILDEITKINQYSEEKYNRRLFDLRMICKSLVYYGLKKLQPKGYLLDALCDNELDQEKVLFYANSQHMKNLDDILDGVNDDNKHEELL